VADEPAGNGGRFQVGIVVGSDLPKMIEFYTDIMGFTHIGDVEVPRGTVMRYVLGESGLKLVTFDEPPQLANPPGGPTARGLRYLTVEVANVAATVGRCAAFGCDVPMPLFEHDGAPIAIVADPEGNWVELIEAMRRS
jgi:catechol 2,3-dioxygenase-like lactoylglutathione lyase family enzyme